MTSSGALGQLPRRVTLNIDAMRCRVKRRDRIRRSDAPGPLSQNPVRCYPARR
jgi:hypothetical protein